MGSFKLKKNTKPKFNEKDFIKGADDFGNRTAVDFLAFVRDKFLAKQYDFSVIEQLIQSEKISQPDLANQITAEKHLVFIKEGNIVDQITYKELFSIFEHGRKDKGILPNPVISKAFEEYNPIYRKRVRSFLLGK